MTAQSQDPTALAEPLGTAIRYVMLRASKEGKRITLTSGRRTREQQIELRKAHCGTTEHAIYDMPSEACSPPTARPGTSKHETGNAADLDGDKEWAAAVLAPFGFGRPIAGEDWHFEYTGDAAEFMGKPIAVWQIQQDMRARGYTEDEMSAVLGYDVDFSRSFLQKATDVIFAPIAAGAAVLDQVDKVADLAGATLKLVLWLLDPGNWRRLAFIAAGVIFIIGGTIVAVRDLRSAATGAVTLAATRNPAVASEAASAAAGAK